MTTKEDIDRILTNLRRESKTVDTWQIDAFQKLSVQLNNDATVRSVEPGGQAKEAGVEPGWRITSVNETLVTSATEVLNGEYGGTDIGLPH